MNKANKLFNEISNNTLNNEKRSVDIIEHYTSLNVEGKLKSGAFDLSLIILPHFHPIIFYYQKKVI